MARSLTIFSQTTMTWAVLAAMVAAAGCAAPAAEESAVAASEASPLAQATPIRHATRLSCSEDLGDESFELDVFDDGERTTRATLLGPSWQDLAPVVLAPVDERTIGNLPSSYRDPRNHIIFRAGAAGRFYVVPKAIGRLTIFSTASTERLDGHLTVVEESGFPHHMTCVASRPYVTASDVAPAIVGMIPRGEHRGQTPAGRPCSVVVEDARPLEVTPDMDEETKSRLAIQQVALVVRVRTTESDGTTSGTYFTPAVDASMLQSAQPDVLHVDADCYTWMAPAAIGMRSLLVERAQGGARGYHVTIGFPGHPEEPLAICDTE